MQTLIQFEETHAKQACQDYGITRAEYVTHYPRGSRVQLWHEYLDRETRNGAPLTRHVERSIRDTFPSEQANRIIQWLAHNVELAYSRAG